MKRKHVNTALITLAVLINVGLAYWYSLPRNRQNIREEFSVNDSSVSNQQVTRLYGLAVDSFNIETNTVKRNQNLGSILEAYSIPERALTQLMLYCDRIF